MPEICSYINLHVIDMKKNANIQTVLVKYAKYMHKKCDKYAQICK